MSEDNQNPRIPLSLEELDKAHAAVTGQPTVGEQCGWKTEDYSAIGSAFEEQFKSAKPEPDARIEAIFERIPTSASPVREARALSRKLKKSARACQVTPRDRAAARRKAADPDSTMNAREAAAYLGISPKTVYEHPGLVKVSTGTRKVLFTTRSVIAVKNAPPD